MSIESQKDQRYIYVLLSRTHTMPARLIRLFTGEPYSHTSIALDIELKSLYSFARKHIHLTAVLLTRILKLGFLEWIRMFIVVCMRFP